MKISALSTAALIAAPTVAFVPANLHQARATSQLEAQKVQKDTFWGVTASVVAGLTLASQAAFADVPSINNDIPVVVAEEHLLQQPAESSSVFVSAIETMDFSMPSYGSLSGDSKTGAPKQDFDNPFSDFSFPTLGGSKTDETAAENKAAEAKKEAEQADQTRKQEEREAEKARKQAEREAEQARRQAEKEAEQARKEAEQARKEEEKAEQARKQEEKEARRREQQEKMKAAADRAAERAKESGPTTTEPSITEKSIPEFKAPEIPEVKFPSFSAPKLDLPSAPSFSEFKGPDIKVPAVSSPEMPKVDMPKMPKLDLPKAPSLPSLGSPETTSDTEEPIEPQEVRDAKAREARVVFNQADDVATAAERQAAELRSIANEKKKLAKEAKDIACATRIGGKWICLRPFGSGY